MGKYFKYCLPILKVMRDRKEYGMEDWMQLVRDYMNLSPQERNERNKSGQFKSYNDISWARMHLEKAGLIEKSSNMKYKITQQGLIVLVENPKVIDKNYLNGFESYRKYKLQEKQRIMNNSKKPLNISDLWQTLQNKLNCDIRQQGFYYSLFYNNKRFGILCVQKKAIKITYTLPNLADIMPNTVKISRSPHVKQYKTGKHDGFDQCIKDMDGINIAIDIINKIKSIINKSNDGISTKSNKKETTRTPIHTPITEKHIKNDIKTELLEKVKSISPKGFEKLSMELLKKELKGKNYTLTGKPGDRGIDGEILLDENGADKIPVQVKKYNGIKIRENDLRNFVGALKNNHRGIFITTSKLDKNAQEYAYTINKNLTIIDGQKLVELLIKHKIGVKQGTVIDDDYFSNR